MGEVKEVMGYIKSCLISGKGRGLSIQQLNYDYKTLMGEWIPYQKLGFRRIEDFLQTSPDLNVTRCGAEFFVTAKHSDKSAHMAEMIARQKPAKRKPPRVRFTRGPPSPRMDQTSKWRPKTNYQTTRYQGSNRPQAVSHSQFVNRQTHNVISGNNYRAPSVSSRVVVPEYSSINNNRRTPQTVPASTSPAPTSPAHTSPAPTVTFPTIPAPTVRRPDMNHRLNSTRLQENMKAIVNNNNNIVPNGQSYTATHNGSTPPISSNKTIKSVNNVPVLQTPPQFDLGKNSSTDPLLSTRKRISKKISELSLDRDSGNSSPTNEVLPASPNKSPDFVRTQDPPKFACLPNNSPDFVRTQDPPKFACSPNKSPDFVRTQDPLADLKYFAQIHKLGEVSVNITKVNSKRNKFYSCKIKVGLKHTYSSYPNDFSDAIQAQSHCCEQALTDLIPKCKRKSLMISSEKDMLERIPPMLEKHNHGIWASQLKLDYADKYNEMLSDDWMKIIDSSPCVHIEKMSEDYILYHCNPGDKGQQRGAGGMVLPSNVSIPANTVQFGMDGKLEGQVTCVMSANEIWCLQVGTEESNRFVEMLERLQIYYQEHEKRLVPESISPAGYYIAKFEGLFYRVRAVKVGDEEVDCFFIDCGDEFSVSKSDIFVLERVYATSQAQAFVCRLSGLEDLYDMSVNSQSLASICEKCVVLELAEDITNNANSVEALPVFMYDAVTGDSINEELIPKLTIELATPCLQTEGITEVFISNIESNGDVYVQVRSQGYEDLQSLRQQIEEQIIAKPPREILCKVTKSNSREKLYFMKHSVTGSWYRTKLIDWSPDGLLAQIYFVDEGHADVITVAEETLYPLESLNDVFNNYPYQATRVRMELAVIPSNFVDLATRAMPKDHPVLLKVLHTAKDDIPLVKLFRRNTDGGLFCINESLALQTELTTKEDNLKSKFKLAQYGGSEHVPSTGSLKCPPLPKIEDESFFEVNIPVAVSPYNFFVQPFDSRPQLDEMMEKLQERYKSVQYGNLKVDDVMPGSIYASRHDDGFWYRTSVIKVINSGSSVSVFYCDFGYYQTLPVKQLVPLDHEFMGLPYQALKAKLAGIKPKQKKWTMEDCEQFKELIEKKRFFANLRNIEKDILYESDLVLKIILVDTSSDDDVSVGRELVSRGIAINDE